MTKEDKKVTHHSPLLRVLTKIVSLMVGCLGVVFGWLESFFKKDLWIRDVLEGTQVSSIIGFTLILQKHRFGAEAKQCYR